MPSSIDTLLAGLFPADVYLACSDSPDTAGPLHAAEAAATGGMVPRRLREFRHGRHLARKALALAGIPDAAIPKRADRSPAWPPGISGSISHCGDAAAAVVAPTTLYRGLGIDIETSEPMPDDITELVLRPEELVRRDQAKIIFSAKEAIYKCLYAQVGAFFDFQAMEVLVEPKDNRSGEIYAVAHTQLFEPRLARQVQGRYRVDEALVACGVWLSAASR